MWLPAIVLEFSLQNEVKFSLFTRSLFFISHIDAQLERESTWNQVAHSSCFLPVSFPHRWSWDWLSLRQFSYDEKSTQVEESACKFKLFRLYGDCLKCYRFIMPSREVYQTDNVQTRLRGQIPLFSIQFIQSCFLPNHVHTFLYTAVVRAVWIFIPIRIMMLWYAFSTNERICNWNAILSKSLFSKKMCFTSDATNMRRA